MTAPTEDTQRRPGAGVAECTRQARQRLRARLVASRGIAGRHHHLSVSSLSCVTARGPLAGFARFPGQRERDEGRKTVTLPGHEAVGRIVSLAARPVTTSRDRGIGQRAACTPASRLVTRLAVEVRIPGQVGADWNDVARRAIAPAQFQNAGFPSDWQRW